MVGNRYAPKNKNTVLNVVYSALLFMVSFGILASLLDPNAMKHAGDRSQIGTGAFIAFGISIVLTVAFAHWFSRKHSR